MFLIIFSSTLARKNTQLVPMDLSAMGSQDQKFQGNCSCCGIYSQMARDCGKKAEHVEKKSNKWMVWHGRQIQRQVWQDKSAKVHVKGKPGEGKGRDKSNGKGKQHGKKGKKGFLEMKGCDGLAFSSFLPLVLFCCERLSQHAVFCIACLAHGQPVSLHLMGIC